jgi:hypothetical protein
MCKKRNPGCTCCKCSPVTDRIDSFTTALRCYDGLNAGVISPAVGNLVYRPIQPGWTVSGGQLIYSRSSSFTGDDLLCIDAVRLPVPFSMEMIVDVAELNTVGGEFAYLDLRMRESTGSSGIGRALGGQVRMIGNDNKYADTVNQNRIFTAFTTNPAVLWYKMQVDSGGIITWLWINGVLEATNTWGVQWLHSHTDAFLTGGKRSWQLGVVPPVSPANKADWAKFNSLEVHEWDHTVTTRPDPDNP